MYMHGGAMRRAKIFKWGNSQAIRLPKDFRFDTNMVEIFERNGDLIIRPIPTNLGKAFELLSSLPQDFFAEGRKDPTPQDRNLF
jgi:antitoxin VapB